MQIKDLSTLENRVTAGFDALVVDIKTLTTKANKPYIQLKLQDNTGTIEFPIWDNYETNMSNLEVGKVFKIVGRIGRYNDVVQIQDAMISKLEKEVNYNLFVPSYDVPVEVFDYFFDTVKNMEHKYKLMTMELTGCLGRNDELWKQFTSCVSAEKHHGNKRGGLILHTVGVLRNIEGIINNYTKDSLFYDAKDVLNIDRLKFKAIVHDIEKLTDYEYEGIIRHKPNKKYDHVVKGIIALDRANIKLNNILDEETIEDISYSILSHHGQWGKFEPKSLEDWLLHISDLIDARIVGEVEKAE